MKKLAAMIIGIMFAIAFIVFFGIGRIPLEVFCSVATGAIVWFFKEKEYEKILKLLKGKDKDEK